AVDNERFASQARELEDRRWEIRREWEIPESAICVLFCGKFIPKKRPLDLIKAAQLLLRSRPELTIHLLFVGSGELGAELRANCNVVFDAERPNSSLVTRHSSLSGPINKEPITLRAVGSDEPEANNRKPPAS